MKNAYQLVAAILTFLVVSCTSNPKQETDSGNEEVAETTPVVSAIKKYQVKSGIITFDNDMMGINQKSVLYFDDYGMKEAEERYDGENVKETNFCDGKNRYILIHKEKTAYTSGNCYRGTAYKFDWEEISKSDPKYKVKKLGNKSVAGKDCESYSMESGDYPTVFAGWNNVCLFMETQSKFGTVIMKAVKVEENANVPAGKFQVPEGYEVKTGI
jgi:hypothetical protein